MGLAVDADPTCTQTLLPPFQTIASSQTRFQMMGYICAGVKIRGRAFSLLTAPRRNVHIPDPVGFEAPCIQDEAVKRCSRRCDDGKCATFLLVSPRLDAACRVSAQVSIGSGVFHAKFIHIGFSAPTMLMERCRFLGRTGMVVQ